VVEVLGGRDEKIEQRRGFGLQNQKPMCAGSILVLCMQMARGPMEDVCGKEEIRWLKCWGVEMKRSSRGGVLACKTEN
jgi:hypothetical protein